MHLSLIVCSPWRRDESRCRRRSRKSSSVGQRGGAQTDASLRLAVAGVSDWPAVPPSSLPPSLPCPCSHHLGLSFSSLLYISIFVRLLRLSVPLPSPRSHYLRLSFSSLLYIFIFVRPLPLFLFCVPFFPMPMFSSSASPSLPFLITYSSFVSFVFTVLCFPHSTSLFYIYLPRSPPLSLLSNISDSPSFRSLSISSFFLP